MPSQSIEVSGAVYRPGTASVAPITVQVGQSTTQLSITNSDPDDGYSENLIATVVGTTGGVTASGTTGEIAPQATNDAITLGLSAASPGTVGTVTLDFTTDGRGIDGLGTEDLGEQTFSVTVQPVPFVTAIAENPSIGDLNVGNTGTFALAIDESVTVTGTPTLSLNDGGSATYDAAESTATDLVFNYSVTSNDNSVSSLAASALNVPADVSIVDGNGNNLDTSLTGLTQTGPEISIGPPSFAQNPGNIDEWILFNGSWEASAGPGSHPSGYNVVGIGDWRRHRWRPLV